MEMFVAPYNIDATRREDIVQEMRLYRVGAENPALGFDFSASGVPGFAG